MRKALPIVVVALAAFVLRCRFLAEVFLEGRILPYDPDSSIHLFRIESAVRHGLFSPARFDPFLNAPDGAMTLLPDGFDILLALFARPFGTDRYVVQVASMLAMPLLGMGAVLCVYALGRKVLGHWEGIVAAAFAALLPAHILGGVLGHVDHHVLELALPPLTLALLLSGRFVIAGLVLAVFVHCVPAVSLHLAAIDAALVGAALYGGGALLLRHGAIASLMAAVLALLDSRMRSGIVFYMPSALTPLLLCAGAAALGVLSVFAQRGRRVFAIAVAVSAVVVAVVAAIVLREAAGFVGRKGILSMVMESAAITDNPWNAIELFSLLLPVAPLLLIAMAWKRPSPGTWAVATAGLVGFVLYCFQLRFGVLLAPAMCVAVGWAVMAVRPHAVAIAVVVLALVPSLRHLHALTVNGVDQLSMLEACEWLSAHTPQQGDRAGGAKPTYSLLTMWGDGSHYAYLADRPTMVGGMYHGDHAKGLNDALAILFGDEDPTQLLDKRKVEWVVLPAHDTGSERAHREIMGLDPSMKRPTFFGQLFDVDGAAIPTAAGVVPALDRMRLVHESPYQATRKGRAVPAVKIFQRVRGANLVGTCDAQMVLGRARTKSDQGRDVGFVASAPCNGGRFELRMPYAGAIEVAHHRGMGAGLVNVSEGDVVDGKTLSVN